MRISKLENRLIDAIFAKGLPMTDLLGGRWATWVNGIYQVKYRDLRPRGAVHGETDREVESVTVDSLAALESSDKQRILENQTICFTWRQVLKAIQRVPR